MKWVIPALLACLLMCGLTACFGGGGENPTTTATPEQTTTEEPEFTTQIVEAMIDPDFDAQTLFQRLKGFWNDSFEYPGFMGFVYADGKPSLFSGIYESETNGIGTLIGGRENIGEGTVTLYFQFPAYTNEDGYPVPERTEELQIDLTGIDNGELRIRRKTIWWTYEWSAYTYGGKTAQDVGIMGFFGTIY